MGNSHQGIPTAVLLLFGGIIVYGITYLLVLGALGLDRYDKEIWRKIKARLQSK
jgi:hypothetical protein